MGKENAGRTFREDLANLRLEFTLIFNNKQIRVSSTFDPLLTVDCQFEIVAISIYKIRVGECTTDVFNSVLIQPRIVTDNLNWYCSSPIEIIQNLYFLII